MLRRLGLFLLALSCLGAAEPQWIPRIASGKFVDRGFFEGGQDAPATLAALRVARHDASERWVFDFGEPGSKQVGKAAPKFRLEYFPQDAFVDDTGKLVVRKPARFLFLFRALKKNKLVPKDLTELAAKSRFVSDVVSYPPIEGGDTALELLLRRDVVFEAFQPGEREGRLVVDLKSP